VRAKDGRLVSLDNLVSWKERTVPGAIYRHDRYVSATVSGGPAAGYTLGDGILALDQVAQQVLPATFNTTLAGQSRDFRDSASSLVFAFALALLIVYLVLAAQFESFVDPAVILLSVPVSLAGALSALALSGSTLNVFSQIGLVMLVGLVTKNGILIVEFANQRRDQGHGKLEAVLDASRSRFRPILMTSLATILGILPIAFSLGAASGSRQSLGILATFLSLYIVPALYALLSPGRRRARGIAGEPTPIDPTPVHAK